MDPIKLPKVSDSVVDGLGAVSDIALEIAGTIPGVGPALEIANKLRSIVDTLFARKIVKFLNEFGQLSPESRNEFFERLAAKDETERFGETVLLLLEKADDPEKPAVIGRLIRAAVLDKFSLEIAFRLCAIVNRSYFLDLKKLEEFESENTGSDADISSSLMSLGLLKIAGEDLGTLGNEGSGKTYFRLNKYGEKLLHYGLRESE